MNLKDLIVEEGIPIPGAVRSDGMKEFVLNMPKYSSVEFVDFKDAKSLSGSIRYHGFRANVRKQLGGKYRVWKMEKRQSLGHEEERSTDGSQE